MPRCRVAVWMTEQALYYSPDGERIKAVSAMNGEALWLSGGVRGGFAGDGSGARWDMTVVAVTGRTVAAHRYRHLMGLDVARGTLKWRYSVAEAAGDVWVTAGEDGMLYIAEVVDPAERIVTITALDVERAWEAWRVTNIREHEAFPSRATGVSPDVEAGELFGYRTADGAMIWVDTPCRPEERGATGDVTTVHPRDGVYSLKSADGESVWNLSGYGRGEVSLTLVRA